MSLHNNLQYKPIDTSHIRREIESSQTIIELLLIMAEEKEEKPARTEPFESTFKVDGKERTVMRTPDGRFGGGSVKKAANSVGKAVGDAAGAVGKAAGSLLETDADRVRKEGGKGFDGNLEILDSFGKEQIKKHPELQPKLESIAESIA